MPYRPPPDISLAFGDGSLRMTYAELTAVPGDSRAFQSGLSSDEERNFKARAGRLG